MSFLNFIRNQYTHLPQPQPPANIAEAVYIVTGANTGLGFACAVHLARLGARQVILAVRSLDKGTAALAALRRETVRPDVGEVWLLDQASLDSVEAFAQRVRTLDRLDGLVANAGLITTVFGKAEGMEQSLVVNVVATALLVFRTLPTLQATARRLDIQTHAVVVSSNSALIHGMQGVLEKRQGDLFDSLSTPGLFDVIEQYHITKLMEIYLVRELASLLPEPGVIVSAVSPGMCYSDLDRNGTALQRLGMAAMRKMFARTAEEGSRNMVAAVFAGPESHGAYFSECRVKNDAVPTWVTDEAGCKTQKRVWEDLVRRLASRGHSVELGKPNVK